MKDKKIINSVNLYSGTAFPYLVLNVEGGNSYPRNPGFQTVHWHEDLQFVYVAAGSVTVKTLTDSLTLGQGEGVFINKNVVHFIDRGDCRYYSFIFPDRFLKFYAGSPAEKTVGRIVGNPALPCYKFSQGTEWHGEILRKLQELSGLERQKDDLYAYRVLCTLSSLWLILQSNLTLPENKKLNIASVRMKLVLEYIHGHFAEQITLEDMAKAANVSVSEVLRCFRSCMQTTPYKYVTELRLKKAAALLAETDDTITSISDRVGFSSSSHFGKFFKEKTGLSPTGYRTG